MTENRKRLFSRAENHAPAALTGLQFHDFGMAMTPFYTVRAAGDGYECAVTRRRLPLPGVPAWEPDENPRGRESFVPLTREELDAFEAALTAAGLDEARWDGFRKHKRDMLGVRDAGRGFELTWTRADGTVHAASGYNVFPAGYRAVRDAIHAFFGDHTDYSAYYPDGFAGHRPEWMQFSLGPEAASPGTALFRLELRGSWKQWSAELRDPRGEFLPAGTSYSGYGNTETELPFGLFTGLLERRGLDRLNRCREEDSRADGSVFLTVRILMEEELEFDLKKNLPLAEYGDFVREFAETAEKFVRSVK